MILEAMYNGEFYPCETVVPTFPEYRKAIQTCAVLMEQLSHRLSKEDYALVEELWWRSFGRRTLSPSVRKVRAISSMAFQFCELCANIICWLYENANDFVIMIVTPIPITTMN